MNKNRPYFLWDYKLSEGDIRRILAGTDQTTKLWIIGRILESARFADVWKYLKLHEVAAVFSQLKLREPIRKAWQRAIRVWSQTKG